MSIFQCTFTTDVHTLYTEELCEIYLKIPRNFVFEKFQSIPKKKSLDSCNKSTKISFEKANVSE
jgi:hypothetical protein